MRWGVRWFIVQRMLIDMPSYEPIKSGEGKDKDRPLNAETAKQIMEKLQGN